MPATTTTPATIEASLGSSFTVPRSYAGDGARQLALVAADPLGNSTVLTRDFTIDRTAPAIAISNVPAFANATTVASIGVQVTDACGQVSATVTLLRNGQAVGTPTSLGPAASIDTTLGAVGPLLPLPASAQAGDAYAIRV